jgi:hypothetical protein
MKTKKKEINNKLKSKPKKRLKTFDDYSVLKIKKHQAYKLSMP